MKTRLSEIRLDCFCLLYATTTTKNGATKSWVGATNRKKKEKKKLDWSPARSVDGSILNYLMSLHPHLINIGRLRVDLCCVCTVSKEKCVYSHKLEAFMRSIKTHPFPETHALRHTYCHVCVLVMRLCWCRFNWPMWACVCWGLSWYSN